MSVLQIINERAIKIIINDYFLDNVWTNISASLFHCTHYHQHYLELYYTKNISGFVLKDS